jgi:beta-glucosidase
MYKRPISFFLGFVFLIQTTIHANVTGRVVDQSSTPVKDAMITYTSLENRLVWVCSDANGNFSIPGPGEISGVRGGGFKAQAREHAAIQAAGEMLFFQSDGTNDVIIEVYSALGRFENRIAYRAPGRGFHCVNPFASASGTLSRGVYFVKFVSGSQGGTIKMINTGRLGHALPMPLPSREGSPALEKSGKAAAVDQIRVGKTSYAAKIVPVNTYADNVGDVQIRSFNVETRVDSLFALMAQADIVAQLIQTDFREAASGDITSSKLGSLFGGGGATPTAGQNNPQDWAKEAVRIQNAALATQFKIPIMYSLDCVHGLNPVVGGTVLPHNIALGATRDPALVEKAFHVTALEAKGIGLNWVLAPCIAVPRHDFWGRVFEGFAETPELTQIMAKAAVLGLQGRDLSHPWTAAACTKHFMGDGGTFGGIDRGNTVGVDSVLKKIHLPGYYSAIEAGTATIMASFSSWNGANMHSNKPLLTDLLKTAMGFDGFIEGDWAGHWNAGGTSNCINAGLDVPMAINKAHISSMAMDFNGMYTGAGIARVNDACKRVLRVKFRMGLFDRSPLPDTSLTRLIGSPLHRDVARECVRKSLVLLKNDNGALPLAKSANIHLMGMHSHNMGLQCGGWTITWQGAMGAITTGTTIQQGFEKNGTGKITQSDTTTGIPADANVVVVVVGEGPYAEMEGDVGNNWNPTNWWKPIELT